jgi:GDP-L-fucose synthase
MSDMKVYIAGSTGMVGRSLVKRFTSEGSLEVLTSNSKDLDLLNNSDVTNFFIKHKPNVVIDAAAKVGGIYANSTNPVDFLIDNLTIQNNLMTAAHQIDCSKFIFLSSSCVYPKLAKQPIKESYLLTGELEKTNQAYAVAKIAGMKLVEGFQSQYDRKWFSVMPTNLYGEFDNFAKDSSHVLPAMIRKFHEAKINNDDVTLWGDGKPLREFLHVNDLADAILLLLIKYKENEPVNIGVGEDLSILELSTLIKDVVGFTGEIHWDQTKPNGTPRKLLDISKLKNLGWEPKIDLRQGITSTYKWFVSKLDSKSNDLKI